MTTGIYKIDHTLEGEKQRLAEETINEKVKQTFLDFIDELSVQNLTKYRQYFYLVRLRLVARILDLKILSPEKEDIKRAIATLKNTKTMRGTAYSENTISDYVTTLKKFYKWYRDGEYLKAISWIKSRTMASHQEKPDFIITEDETRRMVHACNNTRDKALISLLYDSGCRIGEILTLRNEDIQFDEYGASILVHGKTGNRWVRIVGNSIPQLREHTYSMNKRDYVFTTLEGKDKGQIMQYPQVSKLLHRIEKKAELKRRIYPHLFRHTRATLLASNLKEAPLESQMGWTHGSKMTQTYVHFSKTDIDKAVLRAYGIVIPEDGKGIGETLPKKCERCSMLNESDSKFCKRCGLPLEKEILAKYDEGRKEIEQRLLESDTIDNPTKLMIKNFDDTFKDKILEAVIQQILADPDKKEQFVQAEKKKTQH